VLAWIEAGHGAPLLGAHVVGQDQPLAEKLDGTGGGDTGGADEQLEGLLERFISTGFPTRWAILAPSTSAPAAGVLGGC